MTMTMAEAALRETAAIQRNREGARTFRRSLEEQVLQVLSVNTLSKTFYASREEITSETLNVLRKASREMPEFLAKALVWSRTKALLKTVPTVGLVALSASRDKTFFRAVFDRVILIPDDLRTFVLWSKSGRVSGRNGFGGCVMDPVREWLKRMSEYHAVKYGSAHSEDIALRDILRLSHPRSELAAVRERFGWLVHGWSEIGPEPSPTNPMIWALERLKHTADEDEIVRLIAEYNLPYEVVVPSVRSTSPKVWEMLLRRAPYFNLLRNLNTFERHGVFEKPENVEYAAGRLADPKSVERSKLLPFRFFSAFQAYTKEAGYRRAIADAIAKALDLSFGNMPEFPQGTRIAVAPDVSGSMTGLVSEKGLTRYIDIAGIFAAAVLKKAGETVLLPFDTRLHSVPFASSDSLMTVAGKIAQVGGGGTSLGLPVQHLLDRKIPVDVFIGITDQEEWVYGIGFRCRGPFIELWQKYRQAVNPDAQAFLVTIAPYRDAAAPKEEPGVHFIYGWSEAVVGYIPLMLQSGVSQVERVNGITL